ncbi:Glycosyltransferase involved in cell wall bisynthesis [Reichenbachiella faecimaris]|uniref:Glycosyltransferase involved in cell wall bisynthesis n=1 Tax=Reichenbachiella faecimaris TaxID=692418 RepID=A0A1W2GL92_REIFA|nr:glycosyltransferase family 4 protein [Reichenbachiella faecimaris]SMD37056.1 Glycosyltransferase involved in cell wall bisynthesis [Reichenbachiella faecimaris]
MTRKKILVVTYYWPPSGGGGVQRWLKFVKYLPQFGWEPIVFTPESPEFDLKDDSLDKDISPDLEVLKFPIWEPFGLYKKLFKKKEKLKQGIVIEKAKMSLVDKLSVWIRANLFIPDPRRFWVKPSVKFLSSYIEEQNIDVVVTTGPPHSMHLIGLGLKNKCKVKWVADFRDPWSDWDLLDKLGVKGIARRMHQKLERKVLANADHVLTASQGIKKSLLEKNSKSTISVITNGFDPDDYVSATSDNTQTKFRITHLGLLNELRNPAVLWDCLEELCVEIPHFQDDLELLLAGMVSESILVRLQSSAVLSARFTHLDYISHREVFNYYRDSNILLLLLNPKDEEQLIIPGKLFEYLLIKKPILAIGKKKSEVNDILQSTEAGEVFEMEERQQIKGMIFENYTRFQSGISEVKTKQTDQFSRKHLTNQLSEKLNELIG